MPNNDYANEPNQSRSEDIIQSILDNTEYDEEARSRIEYLLIELKNAIEGGGGGGGVTSYSPLTEKPKIDNHTLQAGNNSSSDLGLQTKLTFDSAPTENSTNPVTSGGVYTALGTKANSADVYNKSAVDTALSAKADKSTTYAKSEVDTALSTKQNTISDLSTIRSGAALGATAVQPVSGKGLSTNDYTTDEKEKLAGIEAQANKTTVDSALSDSSTNPVQNKVVKSALDSKQATLTIAQLAAVNSGITAEKLTQDENNILFNARNGVANVLANTATTTTAANGLTYTVNADKSVTVTGNSTAYNAFTVAGSRTYSNAMPLKRGTYIIKAGIAYDSSKPIYVQFGIMANSGASISWQNIYDTNKELVVDNDTTRIVYEIYNPSGSYSGYNATFYPMIIDKSLYEAGVTDYQPYALSNVELTSENEINKNNILSLYTQGVKNIAKPNTISAISGITIVQNLGHYEISGTTGGSQYTAYLCAPTEDIIATEELYIPAAATRTNVSYLCHWKNTQDESQYSIIGTGLIIPQGCKIHTIYMQVAANTTFSLNVDMMICKKAIYDADPTYQPYAMSNAELTAKEQQLGTDIGAPTITSATTLADYANTLSRGYHTGFFTSASKPSDAPVADNCFCDFFIYSASTAMIRVYPTGTAYHDKIYYKTKVSGTWQSWYQFAGTQVQ